MSCAVHPAVPPQAPVLAALHRAGFPPREAWGADAIALQLAMPGAFGFVAEQGGMILGRVAADEAEVLTLAVVPERRRCGIGRILLQAAMDEARRRGAARVLLEVAVNNAAALALYRSAGFTPVGRRRHYYADGSDALVLRAELATR